MDTFFLGIFLAGALPTAVVAYAAGSFLSRRFGIAARVFVILLAPAVWILVSRVLRSVFPVEPGCDQECYGDFVYVGVMLGGVLGSWLAVLISWAFGARRVA
jgi:hypothetical protein